MPAKYGVSTYGKTYLIDEGFTEIPPLRYAYIFINVLLFVIPTVRVTQLYLRHRANLQKKRRLTAWSLKLLTATFAAFTLNNLLRNSHMIDHICRPVYYHEPKWAYAQVLVTEMEIPTYANFLPALSGLFGIAKLFKIIESGNRTGLGSALGLMTLYVANSLFNLVHYTVEPPSNYGPFPNFNIAGTAITNAPIIGLMIYIYTKQPGKGGSKKQQLLPEELETDRVTRSSAKRTRTPVRN